MKTKLIFQVHDSVVADVPKEERDDYLELLKQVMCHEVREHWKWIITPLELEADCSELNGNWSKMKTIMEYIH
jgi:DNA polymerase I-like protein with 3'-5' exonuclease and polymerase domains